MHTGNQIKPFFFLRQSFFVFGTEVSICESPYCNLWKLQANEFLRQCVPLQGVVGTHDYQSFETPLSGAAGGR